MTKRVGLTVADRELILRIRVEIKMAGLSMVKVADRIGCSVHKVRAQLSGQRRMSADDVTLILTACGWPPERQDALLRLGKSTDTRNVLWLESEEVCTSLIAYSRDVTQAVYVAPTMLPWPVHTDEYAWRAASRTGASQLLDRWALVRCTWTWRWETEGGRMTAIVFLHEDVLRTLTDVLMGCDQLSKLMRMADFPGLSLRIIPADAGVHAASKGPLTLLRFSRWAPLVYQECGNAAVVAGTQSAIDDAQAVIDRLDSTAWDEERSRELVVEMRTQLWSGRRS